MAEPPGGTDGADGAAAVDALMRSVSLALRSRRQMFSMDQRELAVLAGVSKSTVARLEKGDAGVALSTFRRVLDAAGLVLVVAHLDGTPWGEDEALDVDAEGVVDRAGRAFPAHLPATPSNSQQSWDWARDRRWLKGARTPWRYEFNAGDVELLVREVRAMTPLDDLAAEAMDALLGDDPDAEMPDEPEREERAPPPA